jgi:thymidylate synthase (FAD)
MSDVKQKITLISHTPDPEQLVAAASKLCYSDADIETLQSGVEAKDQSRFLAKLVEMGHLSPIEHASFTFGVEGVSRSLLAQLSRHRIASFSVKSQRYVGALSNGGGTFNYVVPQGVRRLGDEAVRRFEEQMGLMQGWYDGWVAQLGEDESGYEDARFVLPNAAETKLIMTMNARELMHFFNLRCCNRAQWEIREMAWAMLALVKKEAPALFAKAGPPCVSRACTEGKMTCGRANEVKTKYEEMVGSK